MRPRKPLFKLPGQAKRQFLHYFRHILREITYLPDPFARKVHHTYIVHRFRAYRPAKQEFPLPPSGGREKRVRDEEHLERLLKDCQARLSWQYRVASGDLRALRKALFLTYARSGPRKHELLRPYTTPDIPQNTEKLNEPLIRPTSFKLPLSGALEAIAKEQSRQKTRFMSSKDINLKRFLKDVLPKENIWGRPMPLARLENAKRRELSEITDRLYPPLSDEEFGRLQGLATGTIPCPPLPTRRTRLDGLPKLPKTTFAHKITPRTMCRLWTEVAAFSSTIQKNEETGAYKVTWGTGKYSTLGKPKAAGGNTDLFAQTIEPL